MVDAMFRGARQFLPDEAGPLQLPNVPVDLPGPGEAREPVRAPRRAVTGATTPMRRSAGEVLQASLSNERPHRDRLQRLLDKELANVPADVIAGYIEISFHPRPDRIRAESG